MVIELSERLCYVCKHGSDSNKKGRDSVDLIELLIMSIEGRLFRRGEAVCGAWRIVITRDEMRVEAVSGEVVGVWRRE